MAVFTVRHTARKTYDCATCTGKINPGEQYLRTTVSPHDETYDSGEGWLTYITHLSPGTCSYEDSLLPPGEVNPCAIDNVTVAGGEIEGRSSTLVIDCACGAALPVPAGGDESAAVEAAFAAHLRENLEADR